MPKITSTSRGRIEFTTRITPDTRSNNLGIDPILRKIEYDWDMLSQDIPI